MDGLCIFSIAFVLGFVVLGAIFGTVEVTYNRIQKKKEDK